MVVSCGAWTLDRQLGYAARHLTRNIDGDLDLAAATLVKDGYSRERSSDFTCHMFVAAFTAAQFPAALLAGVIVALATGSGVALRLLLAADLHGFAAWLAGALFIPTLALGLGVWSGTSKTFEAVYTFWWYAGPGHHIPYIDFMGTAAGSGRPAFYFAFAAALVLISFAGRRAQLAYA